MPRCAPTMPLRACLCVCSSSPPSNARPSPALPTPQAWQNFGSCFFGVILASLFGLPLVLLHNNQLKPLGFGLWIASTVVTVVASSWYWMNRHGSA